MLAKVIQQDSWNNSLGAASPWTQDFVFADGNPGEQDVTAGDAILVFWAGPSANTLSSITDNYGNSYSKIAGASKNDTNLGEDGEWWIATNVAAVTYPVGPRLALTFTYTGSATTNVGFWALEISGVNSATQVTGTESINQFDSDASFSGVSLSGGSVGAIYLEGFSGFAENGITVGSPWSIESALPEIGAPNVAILADTGTQQPTCTPSASGFSGVVCGLAFTGVSIYEQPAPTSCSPTSGTRGTTISNFTVNGSGFGTAGTLSFSNAGITVNSYSTQTDSQIVASITIAATATETASDVTVTNAIGGLTGTLSGAFTVTATASSIAGFGGGAPTFPARTWIPRPKPTFAGKMLVLRPGYGKKRF